MQKRYLCGKMRTQQVSPDLYVAECFNNVLAEEDLIVDITI